ncbi:MAG TPA: ACP S-malonyltransferase [Gemmatimonadaceae bacterium]|nr:ACP S-malonyltransferase [Gemmatimonadaceae bacterium]
MSTDIVLLFPGQGSQKPGMGKDLADAFPAARAVFEEVDATLGAPISRLCFEGPADELTLTHNAQPALLAHGAAVWAVARERLAGRVRAAAGHSLGEFTAYHAAGSLSLADSASLVRRRGELMYRTGTERPGAMGAVLGQLGTPVDDICAQASAEAGLVVPANYNNAEQVVVSGEVSGVDRALELAKAAGAKRAVRLNVSGAFHSPLMEPAVAGLREALAARPPADPGFPVYSNVTEQPVERGSQAAELLARQLTSPVRWQGLVRNIAAAYPGALFVEMGPGNVLTGLMKRIAPDATVATCGTAADVEKLLLQVA